MKIALNLARTGIGQTGPNPSVGCIVVKDGVILAQGRTAKKGRPHAENIALGKAGKMAKGAIIYVTLEPCSHHGKTPPCAEGIIKAKPTEVVVACLDPDARVNGRGIKMLAEAGIKVTLGTCEQEALEINRGFIKRIKTGLPFVTLKAAISADGKYLPGTGKPQWVTGELARSYVHLLRSRSDALITGTGTIKADNPKLNVRLPGLEDTSPQIFIMSSSGLTRGSIPPILDSRVKPEDNSLRKALEIIGKQGINNVLVECGPTLAESFIKQNLVDELVLITSPNNLEGKGKDYFAPNAFKNFHQKSQREIGVDKITIFSKMK